MKQTVSTRLSKEQVVALDAFAKATGRDRAELLREVVRRGLDDVRLEEAARQVGAGKRTLSSASELAGRPIPEILDAMGRLGLTLPYDESDLEEDLRWASSSTRAS